MIRERSNQIQIQMITFCGMGENPRTESEWWVYKPGQVPRRTEVVHEQQDQFKYNWILWENIHTPRVSGECTNLGWYPLDTDEACTLLTNPIKFIDCVFTEAYAMARKWEGENTQTGKQVEKGGWEGGKEEGTDARQAGRENKIARKRGRNEDCDSDCKKWKQHDNGIVFDNYVRTASHDVA